MKKKARKSKIVRSISLIVILSFVLLFINCARKKEEAKEKVEITIAQWGHAKYLIYIPVYIAQEKGFFAEEGIETKIKFSGNDDQTFATVIKGEAQFGVGDPIFTAISREQGYPGKVVASIVDGVSLWGLTKNPDLKFINKTEDFANLTIGTFPAPSTTYTLVKKTIQKGGEALKNTKIKEAPIGTQIALLEKGEADIVMMLEPGASQAENMGYRIVCSFPQVWGPFVFTGLTTTEDYINSHPDIVQKVVNALEKSVRFAHADYEGAVEVGVKVFPDLSKEVVSNAIKRMLIDKTIPEHVDISDEAWQKALQVRVDVGDLKKLQQTAESVDNSFAKRSIEKFIE